MFTLCIRAPIRIKWATGFSSLSLSLFKNFQILENGLEPIQLFALLSEFLVHVHSLIGIGIGAFGPLDRETGVIYSPETFPAEVWINARITARLKQVVDCKIVLNNGAALEEYNRNPLYSMSDYGSWCNSSI